MDLRGIKGNEKADKLANTAKKQEVLRSSSRSIVTVVMCINTGIKILKNVSRHE